MEPYKTRVYFAGGLVAKVNYYADEDSNRADEVKEQFGYFTSKEEEGAIKNYMHEWGSGWHRRLEAERSMAMVLDKLRRHGFNLTPEQQRIYVKRHLKDEARNCATTYRWGQRYSITRRSSKEDYFVPAMSEESVRDTATYMNQAMGVAKGVAWQYAQGLRNSQRSVAESFSNEQWGYIVIAVHVYDSSGKVLEWNSVGAIEEGLEQIYDSEPLVSWKGRYANKGNWRRSTGRPYADEMADVLLEEISIWPQDDECIELDDRFDPTDPEQWLEEGLLA